MFIRIWSVNICKYPDSRHKLRDIKMLQKGSLENWLGSLDCHKLTHQICLHVINYHTGEVLFNVHRFLIFIFSSHYAELCKFDTCRKWVFSFAHLRFYYCTHRVVCIFHVHMQSLVELSIAHAELCVFFMFTCRVMWVYYCSRRVVCILYYHMQSHVFSCSHAEPCEWIIAHAESCVFFMFTWRVVWVYYCTRRDVCNGLLCVYFSFSKCRVIKILLQIKKKKCLEQNLVEMPFKF